MKLCIVRQSFTDQTLAAEVYGPFDDRETAYKMILTKKDQDKYNYFIYILKTPEQFEAIPMINLIIKGNLFEATSAAEARGLKLSRIVLRGGETLATAGPDTESACRAWYNEDVEMVDGYGYPAGTLLHFSKQYF